MRTQSDPDRLMAHPMTREEFREAMTKPNRLTRPLRSAPIVSPYVARYLAHRDDKYTLWIGVAR